jgi:hypothetical protein
MTEEEVSIEQKMRLDLGRCPHCNEDIPELRRVKLLNSHGWQRQCLTCIFSQVDKFGDLQVLKCEHEWGAIISNYHGATCRIGLWSLDSEANIQEKVRVLSK